MNWSIYGWTIVGLLLSFGGFLIAHFHNKPTLWSLAFSSTGLALCAVGVLRVFGVM